MFDPDEPRNNELLTHVGRRGHIPPSEGIDLGTHYDLIDHLWQDCNSKLVHDCRWVVAFRPALVNPKTGVAFAIAMGTSYFIRIPEPFRTAYVTDLRAKALRDGERRGLESDDLDRYLGHRTGVSRIGPSWASGWFLPNEGVYIHQAYEACG